MIHVKDDPCEACGSRLGRREFHAVTCARLIEETAKADIAGEADMRQYVGYESAEFSRAKNAEMMSEWPASRDFHRAVEREIKRQKKGGEPVYCRRCEEIEHEAEARALASDGGEVVQEDMTGRHQLAHEMAVWLESKGMAPSRECVVERDASKRYHRICWLKDNFGGEVQIYGETWIRVTWMGDGDWMSGKGHRVFPIDLSVCAFMESAFVDKDWGAAERVPVRPEK